jgi:hypothetical protein
MFRLALGVIHTTDIGIRDVGVLLLGTHVPLWHGARTLEQLVQLPLSSEINQQYLLYF